MYLEGGAYSMFTGYDCSVNLAKMDFSKELLNTYHLTNLDESEKETLDNWFENYEKRYKKVGKVII
jgi:hypothetical protein